MSLHFGRAAFAAVSLCALAACTSGSVEPVTVADESWITDVQVAAIHVERGNEDVPPEVMANLSTHLRAVMDECVTGQRPIDLRVRVDHFEDSNGAAAFFIGDSTGMAGSVVIEDPQTGGTKGEYYIDSMQAGGGIIGAIALSGAENDMPLMFAEQLCEEVFSGTALGQEAGTVPEAEAGTVSEAENDLPTDAWGTSVDEVGAAGTSTSSIYQAPVQYNPETE